MQQINLLFNSKSSTRLHIDLNSCFATIEQQANPKLRGKPIAVAAYDSPWGCILAPSIEAKKLGIKTGMRVKDGRAIYPNLIVLPPDPWKYRNIHLRLKKLLSSYTDRLVPKSIDEFVMDFAGTPTLNSHQPSVISYQTKDPDGIENSHPEQPYRHPGGLSPIGSEKDSTANAGALLIAAPQNDTNPIMQVAREIKQRIKQEIGEWLTVSIGIAPNRYLAKIGAGLHKPDGLDEINKENYLQVYAGLELVDLCGIKERNARRLNRMGIKTVLEFYQAPIWKLKAAFESVVGYDWYMRLRGFEVDDVEFKRRSYGNSFALPPDRSQFDKVVSVLQKLVEKMGARIRQGGYRAGGVQLWISFRDGTSWHHGHKLGRIIFDSREIYQEAYRLLQLCPEKKPVRVLMVSCFDLTEDKALQLDLFRDLVKQEMVVKSLDVVNERYGSFVVSPATMMAAADLVHDRIAFGNVKELEEFTRQVTSDMYT